MRGMIYVLVPQAAWWRAELTEPPSLARLQELVGGYIEAVPHWTLFKPLADIPGEKARGRAVSCVAYCDEEGKLNGKLPNTRATIEWDLGLRQLMDERGQQVMPDGLCDPRSGAPSDYLVGQVVVVIGDEDFMFAHVAEPPEEGEERDPEWWPYGEFIPWRGDDDGEV